jgi:hypothetical protein
MVELCRLLRQGLRICAPIPVLCVLLGVGLVAGARAEAPPAASVAGIHDFDFELGTWTSHGKRLLHPLTGSTQWLTFTGTSKVRPLWGGRANIVELQAVSSQGAIDLMSLRLFNPKTRQWTLYYANAADGSLETPPVTGAFESGRGVFYSHDQLNGRPIVVRQIWSDISRQSCRFEQAFSGDGGKTWETNFVEVFTR